MARVNINDIKSRINTNVNDLFTTEETRKTNKVQHIQNINISDLETFCNHPFKVLDDDGMNEIKNSIEESGVLVPIIVRKKEDEKYEIIAGHRRTHACKLLGIDKIPAVITDFDDDLSVIAMVDSNIQRETLLFSEKAFAYKMKVDAIKKQIDKDKSEKTYSTIHEYKVKNTTDIVGEESGESGRQIKRYIRLTHLITPLLDLVDTKKIAFLAGVELSFLTEDEQNLLINKINELKVYPSMAQSSELKNHSKSNTLTKDTIDIIFTTSTINSKPLVIKHHKIQKYFPSEYSTDKMEEIIIMLLDQWKGNA